MKQIMALHFDQAYAGSSQEFICAWLELVRQYEELTPVSSGFSDLQKKAMLSNALEGVKTFRDIKTSEQLDIAKEVEASATQDMLTLFKRLQQTMTTR